MKQEKSIKYEQLVAELEELRHQLFEAHETIEAIRTGQVDALVVDSGDGHQLYTLKTADQAYRVFIEKMNEGAITLNSEGLIIYSNSQFASMLSLVLSEVIGVPFNKFIEGDDLVKFNTLFQKSWSQDGKEEVVLTNGKNKIPVQLSLTTLEFEEGKALSIIITDLTIQKKTQQQLEDKNIQLAQINEALEQSNHDLQQFASVASHDLQEPLRKIQMFSNLLEQRGANALSTDARKYLSKIMDAASRMKTLIIEVLNYSKLSAHDSGFETVDLNEVVKELLQDFELIIEEKSASVEVGELPVIEANRGQIRQVFQNIISNAFKFVKENTHPAIIIRGKTVKEKSLDSKPDPRGKYALISIKDNGIGFDQKYLEQIFTLFERLHSKDAFEGTGIGLAITKKIIEKHHGLVSAKSSLGNGAEFFLLLPIKQDLIG